MNRRLIIQLSILVVLAGGEPFIWNAVQAAAGQLHSRRTQEEQLANLQERLTVIEADAAGKEVMIQQLDLIFPIGDAVPQLLERFEGLGAQTGVQVDIRNIKEEQPINKQGAVSLVPVMVTAEARGRIENIFRYLETIEHIPELVSVQNWNVSPIFIEGAAEELHQMNFSAIFYLQRDGSQ